jgi:hypothetical protein
MQETALLPQPETPIPRALAPTGHADPAALGLVAIEHARTGRDAAGGAMHETPDDLARLQEILDDSYARAGEHLASIHTARARVPASDLVSRLTGMQVFVVATTTRDGRPRTGPVDGFLYRGRVRFGTAATAVRARHLARSPAISATHVRGETLVVTVHGNARMLDMAGADADFAGFLGQHYGGDHYEEFLQGSPYYEIVPERMYAADMSVHASQAT